MKTSAIVSAYYAEEYLHGRLENLSKHDLEIIVVCQEGSKEFEIANSFRTATVEKPEDAYQVMGAVAGLVKLHTITTPDIPTVYQAWNLGIDAASGKYLTSANSDDRHYPGSIAVLEGVLDDHPEFAAAYFDVDRVEEIGGEPVGRFIWREGGFHELYWQGCFLGPMPMWRKSLHDKYGLFDKGYTVAGDYEFWMRIAAGGERFYHVRRSPLGAHLEKKDALEHRQPVMTTWETSKAKSKYRKVAEGETDKNAGN